MKSNSLLSLSIISAASAKNSFSHRQLQPTCMPNPSANLFPRPVEMAARVLAREDKLHFQFDRQSSSLDTVLSTHTHPVPIKISQEFNLPDKKSALRGLSDMFALWKRYHDVSIFTKQQPNNPLSKELFLAAEQVRTEALGSKYLEGVRHNIAAKSDEDAKMLAYSLILGEDKIPLPVLFQSILRKYFLDIPYPHLLAPHLKKVDFWIENTIQHELMKAFLAWDNQPLYGQLMLEAIRKIMALDILNESSQSTSSAAPNADQQIDHTDQPMGETEGTENSQQTVTTSQTGTSMDAKEYGSTLGRGHEVDEVDETPSTEVQVPDHTPSYSSSNQDMLPYQAYTTQYDDISQASSLCSHSELIRLRKQLDDKRAALPVTTRLLANQLMRQLMSKQQRHTHLHLEEGILDSRKLAQIVADPHYPQPYMWEEAAKQLDTTITLLVDNSGSMRDRPILMAALCADILAESLERCGIKVEILGFTTVDWRGGQSFKLWQANDKPHKPGRLNDLRHIVYKSADVPWRHAKPNLGLMLKEGLLKENIDGEAIIWACNRLAKRPEKRRILMVLSDGAPVDDATSTHNHASYLDQHLRLVIQHIEQFSSIELCAIGIGHDVNSYYQQAVTIREVDQLGSTMFMELAKMFGKR
ncbi:MAG: cobaltochelatase subunit CobT [Alphaproteobacteria bacterium]|nr:cobaltochelatase subunit CobT [Alphaproteobacteria bacterium]